MKSRMFTACKVWRSPPNAHTVVISLDDKTEINAVIQDIQFHPVSDKILHVDFLQLFEDKEVTMIIPVRFEGNAPGVRLQGGVLSKNKRKLSVRALPENLPDFITVDISSLNLKDNVKISELLNEDYKFLHPDNMVVCQVKMSRAALSMSGAEGEEGEETEGEESGEAKAEDSGQADSQE